MNKTLKFICILYCLFQREEGGGKPDFKFVCDEAKQRGHGVLLRSAFPLLLENPEADMVIAPSENKETMAVVWSLATRCRK